MTVPSFNALGDVPEDVRQLAEDWPLCFHFDLPEKAVIAVVGAYQGKLIDLLARLFPEATAIVGYEPQKWAAVRAEERLKSKLNCVVHHLGLLAAPEIVPGAYANVEMGEFETDAASLVNVGPTARQHGTGRFVDANWMLHQTVGFGFIDLMVMNIEGYEFTLLPYLRSTFWLEDIDRLAVQWHTDLSLEFGEEAMDGEIRALEGDGLRLVVDDRPAWTYHVRP